MSDYVVCHSIGSLHRWYKSDSRHGSAGGAVATVGAIGASEAVGGGLLITGFATLAHS